MHQTTENVQYELLTGDGDINLDKHTAPVQMRCLAH